MTIIELKAEQKIKNQKKKIKTTQHGNEANIRTTIIGQSHAQHFGRSDGGGGNFWLGSGPSKTIHAILRPQLVWTSKWQCINQTPAHHISKRLH